MKLVNEFIKYLVVIIISLTIGLLVIILQSYYLDINAFLVRIVVLSSIAFFGSVFGRVLFRQLPGILLIGIVFIAILISVLIIDNFYPGDFQFTFFTSDLNLKTPDLSEIGQFLFIFAITIPTVLVLRHKKVKLKPPTQKNQVNKFNKFKLALSQINPLKWSVFQRKGSKPKGTSQKSFQPFSKPSINITNRHPRSINVKSGNDRTLNSKKKFGKIKLPANLFGSTSSDVKLVGVEEHVCPYCLEEVYQNNSRGVTICKECGTWHHQDCWNLSGSCGVAHRNSL